MSEFGYFAWTPPGGMRWHYYGAGPFALRTPDGREHRFEDSDRWGPVRLRKDDEISDARPWGEKHPFWAVYGAWRDQGRPVAEDGVTCIVKPAALAAVKSPAGELPACGSFWG